MNIVKDEKRDAIPLVSVVAPVYKVESYLQECIDSVLAQTFNNFELILIDDGSPDKCGEICDKATKKDMRIRAIHQDNSGVSAARNRGVKEAHGEWICFVDPDDRLLPNALRDLVYACDELGYNIDEFDLIEGGYRKFHKNERDGMEKQLFLGRNDRGYKMGGTLVASGLEYAKLVASYHFYFTTGPWEKIIRRSILIETDALNIPRNFFRAQDALSAFKMSKKIRKALRIQKAVYDYRLNTDGTSLSKKAKYCSFEYTSAWWDTMHNIYMDMPEEWQDVYKIHIATTFRELYLGSVKKTWKLRSPEFRPYLEILQEKKDILSTSAKLCLLQTQFPFTLIPERVCFSILFAMQAILRRPKRFASQICGRLHVDKVLHTVSKNKS